MSKKKIKELTARVLKIEKTLAGLLGKAKTARPLKTKKKAKKKAAAKPVVAAQKPALPKPPAPKSKPKKSKATKPKAKRKAAKAPAAPKLPEAVVSPGTPVAIL